MNKKTILNKTLGCVLLFVLTINPCPDAPSRGEREGLTKKTRLENGLTLIYEKDTSSRITVVQITIRGGKNAEPDGKSGLVYLVTRLALEIPDQRTVQKLMDQATQLFMECGEDYSYIRISCLSENIEESLKVISKIMLKPLFSSIRIYKAKDLMKRLRDADQDEPANVAFLNYLNSFYPNTPYSSSIYGSEESLKAIKKKDITTFHQNHFRGENMIIAVSSDLDEDTIRRIISKEFDKVTGGQPPTYSALIKTDPDEKLVVIDKHTKQSFISAGFLLPSHSTKDYVCSIMAQNLLGKGIDSLLWSLRDEERLAYNIQSRFTPVGSEGILVAYIETENAKTEAAFEALKNVLNALHADGLSPEKLDTNKTFTKSSILQQNETKQSRTKTISFYETLGLGHDFLEKLPQIVDTITLEEINSFIKEHLDPEKTVYVIIGPKKE